jgi:ATP-dependent Clp protease, protease subunit
LFRKNVFSILFIQISTQGLDTSLYTLGTFLYCKVYISNIALINAIVKMQYTEVNNDTVKLKFFGNIGMWYMGADDFTNTFNLLEKKYKDIVIDVHCYGGYVTEGNVIFNSINNSPANVTYNIVGVSASMSSIVQMAANKITIAENGFVMIHRPRGGADGNADDMFASGKLMKSMEKNFLKVYARRSGKTETECAKWMTGADYWFDAEEALALGLVDEIIPAVIKVSDLQKPTTTLGAEQLYSNFTASLAGDLPTDLFNNSNDMKKMLIEAYGLTGVTEASSDTAIADALRIHIAAKDTTIKELKDAAKASTIAQVDAMIANAQTATGSKFDEAKINLLKTIGTENGVGVLAAALSFIPTTAPVDVADTTEPAAPKAMSMITGGKAATGITAERAAWDWSEWCTKDEKGLFALSKEAQGEIYKRTYGEAMPE